MRNQWRSVHSQIKHNLCKKLYSYMLWEQKWHRLPGQVSLSKA